MVSRRNQLLMLLLLILHPKAGTMFELVKALNDGAKSLKEGTPNPISLNAGSALMIAFVTLFPHDSDVSRHSSAPTRGPDSFAPQDILGIEN